MKYDENCIRVLTDEELESHSADSILEIILDEYPNTSPDHLAKMAECWLPWDMVSMNTENIEEALLIILNSRLCRNGLEKEITLKNIKNISK
ncbi:hypothetical protein [Klebsiella pneumoniae]|uniref:hypothetical protein n=1 Tax=Klebsiella pneumoniae TaxID=573 RepID=UPI00165B00A4|nr:hypothetical protein [Klebsiella pneumoniae]